MNAQDFENYVRLLVSSYFNEHKDATDKNDDADPNDVFIVWMCKTLQNNKALAALPVSDGMYYEVTYNGDKKEIYLDAYKKWENKVFNVKE